MRAALAYARRGIPIFPLIPGSKTPAIPKREGGNGHKDATTDPRRITMWWNRYPGANIGVPTGERSGMFVLDVDRPEALGELEAQIGALPATARVRSGSGGIHVYLQHIPGITNRPGLLPPGIDVRGEGGYVVAPPSRTTGAYKWIDARPPAEPPEALTSTLVAPQNARSVGERPAPRPAAVIAGGPIPEGQRNWTLYRRGCGLRARGASEAEIAETLERINEERCAPPLPPAEVATIAHSAARHAPGNAAPAVSPTVLSMLDRIRADWWEQEWRGMGEHSARDVEHALIELARQHGREIPAGVRTSVDYRTVALLAAVGIATVHRAIRRLRAAGRVRTDNANRRTGEAGAFVLIAPPRKVKQPSTFAFSIETEEAYVSPCAPPTAPRLRWSRPVFDRVGDEVIRTTIRRLGKIKGAVIDHLERAGGTTTTGDLALRVGIARTRDLRRRHLVPLEAAGVVECSGETVSFTPDWLDALNCRREEDGEIADHRRDIARYERQREAYRNRHKDRPDPVPEASPDGEIRELERIPEGDPPEEDPAAPPEPARSPPARLLYPLLGRRVRTRCGRGVLWQVFSDRVGVVLDADPETVTFMEPGEVLTEGVA